MRTFILVLSLAIGSGFVGSSIAQEKAPGAPVAPHESTADEKKFDAIVRQAARLLKAAPAYSVDAACEWKTTGNGPERSGKNLLSIVAEGTSKLRVEASAEGKADDGQLVVVSDGKTITRMYPARKLHSESPTKNTMEDLQNDALTRQALRGAGLDFLLKTDLVGHIQAQTVKVADLGIVDAGGMKLQVFKLGMADGREIDVKMTTGERPVPVEMFTTVRVPLADKKTFTLTLQAKLKWNMDVKPTAETFAANTPAGSRKVNDLTEAVLEGDVTTLIGKAVPALPLTTLDGGKVDLADYKSKVVVLYFWATWAAPSTTDMAGLNQFVKLYEAKGATILAVAVGEKAGDVSRFTDREGYKGTVLLDPKGDTLATLKTNSLPAVLLIGKDGTLQAYYRGARPNLRDQLRLDLDQLLKGERLVP